VRRSLKWCAVSGALCLALVAVSRAEQISLVCDAQQTKAVWKLSATLHGVEGNFRLKSCAIQFDPASGKVSGEIVFDASSGQSGNEGRDHKMHKDVLESQKYPEIRFRPDRAEGTIAPQGNSSVQAHGMFSIHGAEHELTVPVEFAIDAGRWTARTKFTVPYVQWGMKNPSNLFLHVAESVDVEFIGGGEAKTP
jgi:polyisoprenoid-binding protein YceI